MIDWDKVSRAMRFPEQTLWETEQLRAIEAQKAALAVADAPTDSATTTIPVEHSDGAQGSPSVTHTPPPLKRNAVAERHTDPVAALSAALDAAASDAERTSLLAAAPKQIREQLNTRLKYRRFIRGTNVDPYAAFTAQLDAATDDSARVALIARVQRDPQRGAAFLGE